jgi:hydrogenase maturation protease
MTGAPEHRAGIVVVGVGNAERSDDGLGPAAAARLRAILPRAVRVHTVGGELSTLLDAWDGAAAVVLIDAVRSGAVSGTMRRFDAGAAPLPAGLATASTHGLSLAQAIELGRTLATLPPRVIVFGVEARRFGHGHALSPEVEAAVDAVVEAVRVEVARLAAAAGS